jgi:hypothetical protein
MPFTTLPEQVVLPTGVVALFALDPMPKVNSKGGYELVGLPGTAEAPAIQISFTRDGAVIHVGMWQSISSGAARVTLEDGTELDEESVRQLDSDGWEVLWKYGVVPNEFIPTRD